MSPLAVLTGIVTGSAVTITLGLAMVLAVLLILGSDYPRPVLEMHRLAQNLALFALLAAVSGSAFWSVLVRRPWRWYAQAGMWLTVGLLVLYYWPR